MPKLEITKINIEEHVLHVYSSGKIDSKEGDYQIHLTANDGQIDYGPTGISTDKEGNFVALKSVGMDQSLKNVTIVLEKDNQPLMTSRWRFNNGKWSKEK